MCANLFCQNSTFFYKRRDQGIFFIEYRHVHTISYNEDRIHFEEMDMNAYCHSIFFCKNMFKLLFLLLHGSLLLLVYNKALEFSHLVLNSQKGMPCFIMRGLVFLSGEVLVCWTCGLQKT